MCVSNVLHICRLVGGNSSGLLNLNPTKSSIDHSS